MDKVLGVKVAKLEPWWWVFLPSLVPTAFRCPGSLIFLSLCLSVFVCLSLFLYFCCFPSPAISYLRNEEDNARTTAQGTRSREVKSQEAGCSISAHWVVDQPDLDGEALSQGAGGKREGEREEEERETSRTFFLHLEHRIETFGLCRIWMQRLLNFTLVLG